MPITEVDKIWMDGRLVDWADAKVHVLSHALHYGSGVFEGIRAYATDKGPAVWHLDAHLDRLYASGRIYHMEIPYPKDELIRATKDLILANGLDSCYIRPLAFRGYGEMGVNPLHAPVNVTIAVWPWGAYLGEDALDQGVRIKVSSWKRPDQNTLPSSAKATGGYLVSILAKVESLKAGYDEAIRLNHEGFIAEGSGENVFVVKDGVLSTPPTGVGALSGITRASVIAIARDRGYEVVERNLVRTDLYLADEVFFTGTAAELTPIREVDDRQVGEGRRGPVTKELQDAFFAATKGEDPRYVSWLTYVRD
ncbi:MAG: branched-chain amino acid transaminase [Actinomycetota bacterium]